jgi:hypothetical protein
MNSRYVAPKLFFALAALCALAGIALFRREAVGDYLSLQSPVLDLLSLAMIPRLIPFAAAVLSACFGLVYFTLESNFRRRPKISLVLVQLVSYLLAVLGHVILVRFWWRVLGDEHATIPLPVWAGVLEFAGFVIFCLAFATNIFMSLAGPASITSNAR